MQKARIVEDFPVLEVNSSNCLACQYGKNKTDFHFQRQLGQPLKSWIATNSYWYSKASKDSFTKKIMERNILLDCSTCYYCYARKWGLSSTYYSLYSTTKWSKWKKEQIHYGNDQMHVQQGELAKGIQYRGSKYNSVSQIGFPQRQVNSKSLWSLVWIQTIIKFP